MNTPATVERFIQLRAQGRTILSISEELQVAPRTLNKWQKKYRQDLNYHRNVELEKVQDKHLRSHEKELECLSNQLKRVEEVLHERRLSACSTESLFAMSIALRSQIRKQRIEPVFDDADDSTTETPDETPSI